MHANDAAVELVGTLNVTSAAHARVYMFIVMHRSISRSYAIGSSRIVMTPTAIQCIPTMNRSIVGDDRSVVYAVPCAGCVYDEDSSITRSDNMVSSRMPTQTGRYPLSGSAML